MTAAVGLVSAGVTALAFAGLAVMLVVRGARRVIWRLWMRARRPQPVSAAGRPSMVDELLAWFESGQGGPITLDDVGGAVAAFCELYDWALARVPDRDLHTPEGAMLGARAAHGLAMIEVWLRRREAAGDR